MRITNSCSPSLHRVSLQFTVWTMKCRGKGTRICYSFWLRVLFNGWLIMLLLCWCYLSIRVSLGWPHFGSGLIIRSTWIRSDFTRVSVSFCKWIHAWIHGKVFKGQFRANIFDCKTLDQKFLNLSWMHKHKNHNKMKSIAFTCNQWACM